MKIFKAGLFAAAAFAASIMVSAPASAGGGYGQYGVTVSGGHGYYGRGYYRGGRSYYGRGYYRGGRGYHGRRGYHRGYRRGGGGGRAAAIALGVVGGAIILNELAEENRRRDRYYEERRDRRYSRSNYRRYDPYQDDYYYERGRERRGDYDDREYQERDARSRNDRRRGDRNRDDRRRDGIRRDETDRNLEERAPRRAPSTPVERDDLDDQLLGGDEAVSFSVQAAYRECAFEARRAAGRDGQIIATPSEPTYVEKLGGNAVRITADLTADDQRGRQFLRTITCEANADRITYLRIS